MEALTEAQRALFAAGGCLGDYEVLKPIGKGKFAVVHKARRRRDAQIVALKQISAFGAADARARDKTLKELRLVQSVRHENIVQFLDAFIADDALFIAFEWAEAGDLKRQIRKAAERGARFDERTIWRYFTQLCAALQHLHQARIMHRDLKPANVLLTLQGVVKVGDLGLGRHLSEDTMQAHSKVGTPLYMSPEVLRGEGYDWKSDVWSLGCILYELAMLRSPFKSEGLNLYGLFQKISKGDYEPIPPIYSDHMRRLAARMISLSAADRPTMDEVWSMCQVRPSTAVLAERNERIQAQAVTAAAASENEAAATAVATRTPALVAGEAPVVRRRKVTTRRKAAPSPEDTPPASTQQIAAPHTQDRNDASSSSSRPPSSQRSTSDTSEGGVRGDANSGDAAQKHAEARMELLFERLKVLQYDRALQKRISRTHFLADERPQVSAHSRFADMRALATWLLRLLGVDVAPEFPPACSPIAAVQVLLLGAERAGVGASISQLSAPGLTSGTGEGVCVLLDSLCQQALQAQQRSIFRPPVYAREDVDEMEAQDHLEIVDDDEVRDNGRGGGDWGDSTASTPGVWDEDGDDTVAQWLVVNEDERLVRGDGGALDPEREQALYGMIHARVDPAAWQRELEKMTPKLRDLVAERAKSRPKDSSWHARVETMQSNVGLIVSTSPNVRDKIVQAQQVR